MNYRFFIVFCLILCSMSTLFAQDDNPSPSEIALTRITEANEAEAKSLNLSGLGLSELPAEIGQVTSLEDLDLGRNMLSELPPEIAQLQNLRQLKLQGNQFEAFPVVILELESLQALFLGDNKLIGLPPEINRLSNLQQLHLQNMDSIWLPYEIGSMENLRRLEVRGSEPFGVPESRSSGIALLDYYQTEWQKIQNQERLKTIVMIIVPCLLLLAFFLRRYLRGRSKKLFEKFIFGTKSS